MLRVLGAADFGRAALGPLWDVTVGRQWVTGGNRDRMTRNPWDRLGGINCRNSDAKTKDADSVVLST